MVISKKTVDFETDSSKVATLQFARVVSVMGFYPIIIEALLGLINERVISGNFTTEAFI